jgi:ubiquinone/menaquinone biosynthesis C-methylase UbiE
MPSSTDHEDRIVEQFSRWAKPFADLPLHADGDGMARTLAACDLGPQMRVLDVACGPGIVACALAPHAGHVTGIDLTPAMIEQARQRQRTLTLGNMDWQVGRATALPFANASFDRVVTRYSLHHMTDPLAVLAEMCRVCRPGGRIIVIDATPAPECQAAYDRMEILRDPSHTSALTQDELRGLGRALGLAEAGTDFYRLDARLDTLADARDMTELTALFEADIASGEDRLGVAARRADDGIHFLFPISIIAWQV